jgi:hypothetical protein
LFQIAEDRFQRIAAFTGEQVAGFTSLLQIIFQRGQNAPDFDHIRQHTAGGSDRFGQQAFVVALQEQESLRVAPNHIH